MSRTSQLVLRRWHASSRRGVALLLVLGCLILLATLILGFLLTSQLNLRSSKLYANGSSVKALADSVVSIVMGQIQQATSNGTTVAWASQPGMIRTYDNTGKETTEYRLFSWDTPTNTGSYTPSNDANQLGNNPPSNVAWFNSPAVFVDLNQPVADSTGALHFPIIDGNPSDLGHSNGDLSTSNYTNPAGNQVSTYAINGVTPGIEGFWVNLPNTSGGPAVNPTTSTNSNHTTNDIPMPVKWLYVLQDGTIVAPASTSTGTTVTISGASSSNPIVGRVAYWTDDETSKVNINTASEGVYWDTPRADTAYEKANLAKFQPAQNEFQRYPGHPATTCLSTVLGAIFKVDHNSATYTASQFMPYFALAPKLNVGSTSQTSNLGSNAGTAAPVTGAGAAQTGTGALSYKASDRLYTSVDELAFQSDLPNGLGSSLPGGSGVVSNASYARTSSSNGVNGVIAMDGTGTSTIAPNFLEKARFFLTASSRAPDVNLFNQPRIGIWPVTTGTSTAATTASRTALDNVIAFCGTIGGLPYYFQRQNSYSPTNDLPAITYTAGDTSINRNRQLITYLQDVTNAPIPGFGNAGATSNGSFVAKYGQTEDDQILTEIFDYIRCQNLEDPNVSTVFAGTPSFGTNYLSMGVGGYTNQCGKGQVVPIYDSVTKTRGFGRFPTVTEASLMFIVEGWNDNSAGSPTAIDPNYTSINSATGMPWGYYGKPTGSPPTPPACWIFPQGPGVGVAPTMSTATITPGHVRVQAALILSMFDPSQGYPTDNGCYQIEVQGLDKWKWSDGLSTGGTGTISMGFPGPANIANSSDFTNWPVCSSSVYGWLQQYWGGVSDFRTLVNQMGPNQTKGTYKYYPFCSSSIDLPYNPSAGFGYAPPPAATTASNPTAILFNPGSLNGLNPITINIYIPTGTTYSISGSTLVQTIKLNFPSAQFPCPVYSGPVTDSGGTYDMARWDVRFAEKTNPYSPQSFLVEQGKDVARSVRFNTDARLIAGLQTVDASSSTANNASYFTSYVGNESAMLMHSMWLSTGMPLLGAWLGQLVPPPVSYVANTVSTAPWQNNGGDMLTMYSGGYCPYNATNPGAFLGNTTNVLGDWDNGVGVTGDGPYINKADEGDYQYYNTTAAASTVPYFDDWYSDQQLGNAGQTFFSPNRLMPSAVMFGSLSTGVQRGLPWQTLLFNPHPAGGNKHPGFGTGSSGTPGPSDIPPYSAPPDHLLLDLFTMPVVEPYPISEPLSTAGRINMNYQIVPFTYIERATGVRAVLKSERLTAIPDTDAGSYKNISGSTNVSYTSNNYRLPLNLDATLQYFDNFFTNNNDIFRSASQICNMELIPSQDANGTAISGSSFNPTTFWSTHRLTGDNSREKPYADIYPRLTTKSNTFTVHYYVQTLKQAQTASSPSIAWQTWREGTDVVTGEFRGSSTIERYIDPNDSRLSQLANDFASSPPTSSNNYQGLALDQFYKFRVVSSTQFAP